MFLKRIFILITIISKMNPIALSSNTYQATISGTIMIASGFSFIYMLKKINTEKKLFGDFYQYKGNIKRLIEDCNNNANKNNNLKEIKNIIEECKYDVTTECEWRKNTCGDKFLNNFITKTLNIKDENQKKECKKFFLDGDTKFNDYIQKKIPDGFLNFTNKHNWFIDNFKVDQIINISDEGSNAQKIRVSIGRHYTYEEIQNSIQGEIISHENNIQTIIEDFNLVNMIMSNLGKTGKWHYPMGILAGPPGTGKTERVKDVFKKLSSEKKNKKKCIYIEVKSADIFDKWVGSTEINMNKLFEQAEDIATNTGKDGFVLLHIDEIESLIGRRDNHLKQEWSQNAVNIFLQGVDRLRANGLPILILGTTNFPDKIDAAAKREGRLTIIKINPPTQEEITNIIDYYEKYFRGDIFNDDLKLSTSERDDLINNTVNGAEIRKAIQDNYTCKLKATCKLKGSFKSYLQNSKLLEFKDNDNQI